MYFPARTYLIGAQVTATTTWWCDPGATIKAASTFTSNLAMVRTVTNGVDFHNLALDGNRINGASVNGIQIDGSSSSVTSHCYNCRGNHIYGYAFWAYGSGGVAECFDCWSTDSWTAFVAHDTGGVIRTYGDCRAVECDAPGFDFRNGAGTGCRLEGTSTRCIIGARIRCPNGTIGRYVSEQDSQFGLLMGSDSTTSIVTGWEAETIRCTDTGLGFTTASGRVVAQNNSGTSVEMYGVGTSLFDTISAVRPLGYGLALVHDGDATQIGSSYNEFGTVIVDGTNAVDSDPAVLIAGNSVHNIFGSVVARATTLGLSTGEGVDGIPSDNLIGTFITADIRFTIWQATAGVNNIIGQWIDRGSYTVSPGVYPALFMFYGSGVTGNRIERVSYRAASATTPPAGIFAQALRSYWQFHWVQRPRGYSHLRTHGYPVSDSGSHPKAVSYGWCCLHDRWSYRRQSRCGGGFRHYEQQ